MGPIDEKRLDSEFQLLNKRKQNYDSRQRIMWFFAIVAYISLAFGLLSAGSPSLAIGIKILFAVVGIPTLVGAVYLARNSRNYILTREQKGFLEVYQARANVKSYIINTPDESKLKRARTHLSRAIYAIPVASKTSTLAARALAGTTELRSFVRKKEIPYLNNPSETSRVISSLGVLAEFLLDPTMGILPSIIKRLNNELPDSLFPTKEGLTFKFRKSALALWENTISQRSFYLSVLAASAFSIIVGLGVVAFNGPAYEGWGFGAGAWGSAFFAAYWVFTPRSQSSPSD